MSTQWEAANPTAANGVSQEAVEEMDQWMQSLKLAPNPVTIADVEAEIRAVVDGQKVTPSYALASAASADQLRNVLVQFRQAREKKSPGVFEASSEIGGFAALAASVSAVVPNPSGPILDFVAAFYVHKQHKRILEVTKPQSSFDQRPPKVDVLLRMLDESPEIERAPK